MKNQQPLNNYRHTVLNRYHIYNSLFLNLPFDDVYQTGVLLPLLTQACQQGYQKGQSPEAIITEFFDQQEDMTAEEQLTSLFKFIQYIERQIVLFDSIEEAAYASNHDMNGEGTMPSFAAQADHLGLNETLKKALDDYRIRVVLTAHPTQFYPGPVLGIMNDLSTAIQNNDLAQIEGLLQQLGKTPLFNKTKPSPFDEAVSLVWYLENVFYDTMKLVTKRVQTAVFKGQDLPDNGFVELGFWPGGDRDGNPFVDAKTTLKVADRLHRSILKCYYRDVRQLKRRLTFPGVDTQLEALEHKLYRCAFLTDESTPITVADIQQALATILTEVNANHHGLFADQIEQLLNQVKTFGVHFATLDVRQDSRVHHQVMVEIAERTAALPADYEQMTSAEQMQVLAKGCPAAAVEALASDVAKDTLNSIQAIEQIQQTSGEAGANRYIISNCQSALNVMEVLAFFGLAGWSGEAISVDIVPLFETIEDLQQAPEIMDSLYQHPSYRQHLEHRRMRQTIMLGFSDGTKDGGYLTANWAIMQAKEKLSEVARSHGVSLVFFDGRGGPPARGGGEAHKFYASQNPAIENTATQLTIQGQTISANFGHALSAQYNLEQLLSAGLSSRIRPQTTGWDEDSKQLLGRLSELSLAHYQAFKQHPDFVPYLEQISTLKYYGMTNIGSRPTKRSGGDGLVFEDLRAIPFVGAWSQLKQNVLGYYGLGTALTALIDQGETQALQTLYQKSGYFKAIIDNSMMSLCKSFMPLTAYLQDDPRFGDFWLLINREFKAAEQALKTVAQTTELLPDKPLRKQSIMAREAIVLPLLTIQQYALQRINAMQKQGHEDEALLAAYEKLVTRSLYGNINASRNAV